MKKILFCLILMIIFSMQSYAASMNKCTASDRSNNISFSNITAILSEEGYFPKNGVVPDKATAIKIAEAVIVPIYGEDCLKEEKPYQVTLNNNVWIVSGSRPKDHLGGEFIVKISKRDCRILMIDHCK